MDFRRQMLDNHVMDLDGVVFTHHHFDHIGGFDDIRPYNFRSGRPLPIFGLQETIDVLQSTFPYAFGLVASTGAAVPSVDVNVVDSAPFSVGNLTFTPIPLRHGKSLRVNGYRIGNFAYCTDVNFIPESSWPLLEGLDVLILDGLRREPHPTHFTIDESLDVVRRLQPRQTWLTHIAHQIRHADVDPTLPSGVALAYDGLVIQSS
jgi:phosphoribosyl 1,2-cyclic phosphate phosphodiesterase